MTQTLQPLLDLLVPITSPLVALVMALAVPWALRRRRNPWVRAGAIAAVFLALGAAYHAAVAFSPAAARVLVSLNSPFFAVLLVIVLPAMHLPRGTWLYRGFLVLPAAVLLLAVVSVFEAYAAVPEGEAGWRWFLIRPAFLMGGIASLLVLLQPTLSMTWFRRCVRVACLAVLVYGGFAFRQSYTDYEAMVARRPEAKPGIMNLSETSPVLQHDQRMTYLPSAPCRFTADGGYVQGCIMEMMQRVMQVNLGKVATRDPGAVNAIHVLLAAVVAFMTMSFVFGRAFCGWICPLSTLGDLFNGGRRLLGLPHLKASKGAKLAFLGGGLGFMGLTLAMAKAYPHLDANGKFLGCKIPLYPFCKVCPSQQLCPVAAHGPDNYPGLPTWEWGWGFFRIGIFVLLGVFIIGFATTRHIWCRLCPMGMFSGHFNRGGMMTLKKDGRKCNRCGMCAEVCPMDIDYVRAEMARENVTVYDCVLCLRCVEQCPRDACLTVEHGGRRVTESKFEVTS